MNRLNQLLKPRVLALTFVLIAALLCAVYGAQARFMDSQEAAIEALMDEYGRIKSESLDLEERISYTYTDTYIEREARGRLGLVREGETLYQQNGAVESPE